VGGWRHGGKEENAEDEISQLKERKERKDAKCRQNVQDSTKLVLKREKWDVSVAAETLTDTSYPTIPGQLYNTTVVYLQLILLILRILCRDIRIVYSKKTKCC
jgi:hypothetical protein